VKKIFIIPLVVTIILLVFCSYVFAYYYSGSWTSASGSYAPYKGTFYTNSSIVDTDGAGQHKTEIIARAHSMYYSSSAITAIRNYYNNNSYYPGIDIKDLEDTYGLDATYVSSNYPNPKYDLENNYPYIRGRDEAEVVSLSPLSINTTTAYYFQAKYYELAGEFGFYPGVMTGYMEATSHESYNQLGEYNTAYWCQLKKVYYKTY